MKRDPGVRISYAMHTVTPQEGRHSPGQHAGCGPGLGRGEEALIPPGSKPGLQLFKEEGATRPNPSLQRGLNTAQLTSPGIYSSRMPNNGCPQAMRSHSCAGSWRGAVERETHIQFLLTLSGKETETSSIQTGNAGHRTNDLRHSASREIKQQLHSRENSNWE